TSFDWQLYGLAFAPNSQLQLLPNFLFQNLMLKLRIRLDRCSIDMRNYIERSQVAFVSRRISFNCADYDAFVRAFEQVADRRIVTQRLDANAQPRPHNLVTCDQFAANFLGHVNGNCETQAAVHSVDQGVHPNHLAINVAERSAAVARLNRCVGLQIIRDGIATRRQQFVPAFTAYHPISESVIMLELRTDGERKLAHSHGVTVTELDDRQIFCANLNDSNIAFFIRAYYLRGKVAAIPQFHLDFISAFDDVKVREDVAIWPNYKAGAFALNRPEPSRVLPLVIFIGRPLEEQIVER